MNDINYQIAVMTAYSQGKQVQVSKRDRGFNAWHPFLPRDKWNWEEYNYRIHEGPMEIMVWIGGPTRDGDPESMIFHADGQIEEHFKELGYTLHKFREVKDDGA